MEQMGARRRGSALTNLSLPFSFPLLLLILLHFPFRSRSQTPPEAQILLQMKQDWGNPPTLSSWVDSASSQHCTWAGIQCSGDGTVTGISLQSQNLTGPIPGSVCSLRNLDTINLYNNFISGPFPTSLYNCSLLRDLDLSQNILVGELPSDLDRLSPALETLDLSANNFTGDIPRSIGRLTAMKSLYLDANLFNGSIPADIGNLSNLESLALAYNPFAPASIPPEFGKLTKLNFLWMAGAGRTGEIPDFFEDLSELVYLDLALNSLSGRIPAAIWMPAKLHYLYLYKNNLSGEINATTIGAQGLVGMDLSMNQLNGSIPEGFGRLQNLSVLLMYFNQLSGEIPTTIGLLPSLTDLRLFNNRLSGPLPPDLGKHSKLWNLEVDDNRLTGELPENLCAGGKFGSLVVFHNNLTGTLPASLGDCPTLNNIMIHGNGFSGEIPTGIWSAVNLTTVMMHDNDLSGTLPDSLPWNLTRLHIGNNKFSGSIPSSAPNLLVFYASNNHFSGEIPGNLTTGISRLQVLSLGANMITGEIPSGMGSLKSLTDLNLSSNQLVGGIPASIGFLPVLTTIDLSANLLSGEIPPEIGNLRLNFLNLSDNRLSGEIPLSLQTAVNDRSFLSNPDLCSSNSLLNTHSCRSGSTYGSDHIGHVLRVIFLVLGPLFFVVAAVFTFVLVRDYRRRRDGHDVASWKLTSFQSLDFTESSIVRGLTEENLIGSGGSGNVYRVTVGNRAGGIVAVKKIWNRRKLDSKLAREFQSEVKILGSIRHTNIVKLLCCVSSADSKLLVYEYMENGSLDRWLHGKHRTGSGRGGTLDWPTRLRIAIGAASGLCYMHHECAPPIIHRDVKSSNILLDSEFRARIADFGLARMLVKPGEPDTASTAVAGSFGYMAPECAYTRVVNNKMDVYSFGVVLLELTTGRGAGDGGEHGSLAEWAWRHFQMDNKLVDAIDEEIREASCVDEIAVLLRLGLICTGTLPSTRPSMKEVLQILLCCDRTAAGTGDKPRVENDMFPLLHAKGGSRNDKPGTGYDEDDHDPGLASNV